MASWPPRALLLEPAQPVGVAGDADGQHLDRDLTAQARVPRAVDLAHPARSQGGEDLVRTEAVAGTRES